MIKKNERLWKKLLLMSGLLNVLLGSGIYYLLSFEPSTNFAIEFLATKEENDPTESILREMKTLSYTELTDKLASTREVFHQTTERDLALQILVEEHGLLSKPCLKDPEFEALLATLKKQPWLLSTEGLFAQLQKERDSKELKKTFLSEPAVQKLAQALKLQEEPLLTLLLEANSDQFKNALTLASQPQSDKRLQAYFYSQGFKLPKKALPKQATGFELYTVQEGDSLWKIAKNHQTSVENIKKANNLHTDSLRPGLVIRIRS